MNHQFIINKLEENLETFKALFISLSEEQTRWKPLPEKWSLLEVLIHLYDEERFDFRQRIEFAISNTDKEWKRIQPVLWVEEENYNSKDFAHSVENFLSERERSVNWLKEFSSPNWKAVDNYPFGIVLTAEQSLANWLAHDYLHIRQIISLKWEYLQSQVSSIELTYAGDW